MFSFFFFFLVILCGMWDLSFPIRDQTLFSHSAVFDSLWPHGLQQARFSCPSPSIAQTQVRWVSDAIQPSLLWNPLLTLPSIFPSIRVFSSESAVPIRRPMYWSFSFSISPSNEYSRLISFRIDWFDLFAIQGTLKNLLQHHSSKALILWLSTFLMVQLSHPSMTTGKTIALNRWIFVGKAMSLLFNSCLGLSQLFFQGASDF